MVPRLALGLALAVGLAACGPRVNHDGYKSRKYKPWKSPKVLEFDEDNEAEVDAAVDYRRRKRARWYAVDLPRFGKLKVKLSVDPLGESKEIDVAMEILDSSYRVLERADKEEDDAGDLTKKRELDELDSGRYYVHVYTQRKLDRADFTLRLLFEPRLKDYESSFPAQVPYVGILPAVPLFDDSPVKPKKRVVRRRPGKKPVKTVVRGRISGITTTGKGTLIKVDRGSAQGVEKGWRGSVVSKSGRAIPNGGFRVSKVSASESFGLVKATQDAVTAAKYVRLSPP